MLAYVGHVMEKAACPCDICHHMWAVRPRDSCVVTHGVCRIAGPFPHWIHPSWDSYLSAHMAHGLFGFKATSEMPAGSHSIVCGPTWVCMVIVLPLLVVLSHVSPFCNGLLWLSHCLHGCLTLSLFFALVQAPSHGLK